MLTGQAKTDYQREYMRKRRAKGLTEPAQTVRPAPEIVRPAVRPELTKSRQTGKKGFNG